MQQNLLESNKRLNFKAGQANQLDSPPQQTNQKGGKRKSAGNAQNILTISAEFRPLIEAMKSVGKSMVALNDFESHLKSFCQSEGIKVPDVMTLIQNGVISIAHLGDTRAIVVSDDGTASELTADHKATDRMEYDLLKEKRCYLAFGRVTALIISINKFTKCRLDFAFYTT